MSTPYMADNEHADYYKQERDEWREDYHKLRAENKRLREALEDAVYSLEWHKGQGHFVGMDGKHLDQAHAALNSTNQD